jgi:Peptidase family S41
VIPTFEPEGDTGASDFQAVAETFLAKTKAAGFDKLIIDVSANGGGDVFLAYDLFKQLFPQKTPFDGSRFRAHEAVNIFGSQIGTFLANLDPKSPLVALVDRIRFEPFNFGISENVKGENFKDWNDLYGPNKIYGDNFTNVMRQNVSDTTYTEAANGIIVSGYGNRTDLPAQPYLPENILIMADGTCASTCTVFSGFMKNEAGVRSVAIGGRPQTGPMQSVGGTKGSEVFFCSNLLEIAQTLQSPANPGANDSEKQSWTEVLPGPLPIRLPEIPGFCSINLRDTIHKGEDTPTQFMYEAADCRIFETAESLMDRTVLWKSAAQGIWGNGKTCVAGSTGQVTSKPDNGTSYNGGNNPEGTTSKDGEPINGSSNTTSTSTISASSTGASATAASSVSSKPSASTSSTPKANSAVGSATGSAGLGAVFALLALISLL